MKHLSTSQKEILIKELRAFLQTHEDILIALLFGSLADPKHPQQYGDIDLGIYVDPRLLNSSEFVLESRLEAELYRALSSKGMDLLPIEILVLNHGPVYFLARVFKSDYLILKGDEVVVTDFIEEISQKSMANFHFRTESLREVVEG